MFIISLQYDITLDVLMTISGFVFYCSTFNLLFAVENIKNLHSKKVQVLRIFLFIAKGMKTPWAGGDKGFTTIFYLQIAHNLYLSD